MSVTEDRGTRDQIGHMARPVQVPWVCHKTGDCCRLTKELMVTAAEKELLDQHAAAATRPLSWTAKPMADPLAKPTFYSLELFPCPFLSSQGLCMVHEVRPFNCRRFMCGRVDVTKESYETDGQGGCLNLSDRVQTSRRWMEYFGAHQRRAAKDWALSHGWKRSME